jgi:hypothetical protein
LASSRAASFSLRESISESLLVVAAVVAVAVALDALPDSELLMFSELVFSLFFSASDAADFSLCVCMYVYMYAYGSSAIL